MAGAFAPARRRGVPVASLLREVRRPSPEHADRRRAWGAAGVARPTPGLEYAERVDVAFGEYTRGGGEGEGVGSGGAGGGDVGGEDDDLPAVFVGDFGDAARLRVVDAELWRGLCGGGGGALVEGVGEVFDFGVAGAADDDADHAAVRGEGEVAADGELAVVELLEGGGCCGGDGGVFAPVGLDDDLAAVGVTGGAAGDLGEEDECLLLGAEVGEGEGGVGEDDADQPEVAEVEPFGDHLGADEDIDFLFGDVAEQGLEGPGAGHGVGVDAGDAGIGE